VKWRDRNGIRWLEAKLPAARAAFTTRPGGVSGGPFTSLNLGILTGDHEPSVRENRARLAAALGVVADGVLIGRQVHGTEILARDAPPKPNPYTTPGRPPPPEVDGQATARTGLAPLVFVADCLPVALAGTGGVAMLHCGWRGLAGGIVESGVRAVSASAAAIGPGIGRCCYRVGPEVAGAFDHLGEGLIEGPMLDLVEVTRRALERAGVSQIEVAGLCTSCEPELFFSHRRDQGRTGRQGGLVWIDYG
jgi:polyphenol oxidase